MWYELFIAQDLEKEVKKKMANAWQFSEKGVMQYNHIWASILLILSVVRK